MRRFRPLLLGFVLLSGCETLNDTLVRQWFRDPALSHRMNYQIREGLERRDAAPEQVPKLPAPGHLDQG